MISLRPGALVIIIGLLMSACAPRQDEPTTDEVQTGDVMAAAPTWTANLSATDLAGPAAREDVANIDGSARMEMGETPAQSRVEVHITGLQAGTYPWHVHSGTCQTGGPIVGSATAYPPLTVGADGAAHVEAGIPVETPTSGDYHVNVHRSPEDLATIVACGDLSASR